MVQQNAWIQSTFMAPAQLSPLETRFLLAGGGSGGWPRSSRSSSRLSRLPRSPCPEIGFSLSVSDFSALSREQTRNLKWIPTWFTIQPKKRVIWKYTWQLSFGLQATLHSGVRSSLLSKNLSKDGASYDGMVSLGIQAQNRWSDNLVCFSWIKLRRKLWLSIMRRCSVRAASSLVIFTEQTIANICLVKLSGLVCLQTHKRTRAPVQARQ